MAEVATLVIEVGSGSIDKAVAGLNKLTTASGEAETATSALGGAFSRLGAIMAGMELYEAAKNTVMLAARYETLGATLGVMGSNVGKTSEEMAGFQRSLEETGISAIKARSALQIMAAAQLELKDASNLGRVAQDAATLAGINSSDAFNNLVRGITTGEVRIIRHMGIMANFTSALKNYADANGKTVQQLNARERAEARMINVLEEGQKRAGVYEAAMTTAGKQMLSMQRYTENLQVQIGEMFNPSTNAVVFALAEALKEGSLAMKEWEASGGKAAWAAEMREKVVSIIEAVKKFGEVMSDTAGVLKILGAAYAATQIVPYIQNLLRKTAASWADVTATRATLLLKNAEAQATLVQVQRDHQLITAKYEKIQAMIKETAAQALSNKARAQAVILSTEMILSEQKLTAAKTAATAATLQLSGATTTGGRLLAMMGGPIGVVIAGFAALVMWYDRVRDKTVSESAAGLAAAKDRARNLDDAIERQTKLGKRLDEIAKSGENVQTALKKAFDPADMPEIKRLDEDLKKLNDRLAEIQTKGASFMDDFMGSGPIGLVTKFFGWSDGDTGEQAQKIIQNIMEAQKKRKELEDKNAEERKKSDENDAKMAALRKKETDEEEAITRFISFQKERSKLQEEYNVLLFEAQGFGQKEIDRFKAEQDLIQKVNDVWEGTKVDKKGGTAKYTRDQAAALEAYYTKIWLAKDALIDYKEAVAQFNSENDLAVKAWAEQDDVLNNLEKELVKVTHTEREMFVQRVKALAVMGVFNGDIEEMIARYDELTGKIKDATTATAEQHRLDQMATGLNKRHKEDEERLADLNKLKAQGKLIEGVYEKAWFEVMMKGDSAMAYIVQSTSKLFDTLGGYLGDLFTGTSTSFRDMISKMMADLARFFASEAMKKLLMIGIGMFTGGSGGGSDWAGTSSTSGKASGGPVTGGVAYTVGEQGPELFVPGASGTIIPNNMMNAGSSGGDTTISITVNMEEGKKDNVTSSSDTGRQTGLLIASAVRAVIIDEKRPGGLLFAGA